MNRAQDEGPSSSKPPRPSGIRMGRSYQAAFEATIAVVVAGAAGGWADQKLDTAPLLLIAGVILGFATFVLRLVRLMNELARQRADELTEGTAMDKERSASPRRGADD